MPARVNIYCRGSTAHVTAEDLRREIGTADLMTLAECLDLPEGEEAAVEAMWPHLRVSGDNGVFEVQWKPPGGRPLQIDTVDGERARGDLAELLQEELPEPEDDAARAVCSHLRECREIIYIEMGIDDSNHLGATLAEVIGFYLAAEGDGLVWFYHREWASPKDRGSNLWTTE
jgi:hypothetical protein